MFDAKKQLKWSKLKVGMVVTLALFILLIAIFFAGNVQEIFFPKAELKLHFKDVKGLRKGAPVWILGTEVGSVKQINLSPHYGVIVFIKINKRDLAFLKSDSRATIMTMGLLGDKYVELSSGSPEAGPIRPGEMIKGASQVEFTEVMATASASISKMGEFITKLDTLVTKFEAGGTLGKLFSNPALYDNLEQTSRTFSKLLTDISESQGTLKKLVEDPSLYEKLSAAASTMEAFSRRISESRGTLNQLVEDPSLYKKALDAVSSVEAFGRKLSESSGTLNKFLEDPSFYNRMSAAAAQLEEFTAKVNKGSGTLQKIVEDPELYENLNKASAEISSILDRIHQGKGTLGSLVTDDALIREMKETIENMRDLLKEIKEHPKKYFNFSVF